MGNGAGVELVRALETIIEIDAEGSKSLQTVRSSLNELNQKLSGPGEQLPISTSSESVHASLHDLSLVDRCYERESAWLDAIAALLHLKENPGWFKVVDHIFERLRKHREISLEPLDISSYQFLPPQEPLSGSEEDTRESRLHALLEQHRRNMANHSEAIAKQDDQIARADAALQEALELARTIK